MSRIRETLRAPEIGYRTQQPSHSLPEPLLGGYLSKLPDRLPLWRAYPLTAKERLIREVDDAREPYDGRALSSRAKWRATSRKTQGP